MSDGQEMSCTILRHEANEDDDATTKPPSNSVKREAASIDMSRASDDEVKQPAAMKVLPKPYGYYGHPFKTWLDVLMTFIFYYFLRLEQSVDQCEPNNKSEKTKKNIVQLRERLSSETYMLIQACKKWSKEVSGLVEIRLKLARKSSLLKDWKIMDYATKEDDPEAVEVTMRFPASILKDEKRHNLAMEKNEAGCYVLDSFDLKEIPLDIPIIVWLHGGACVLGDGDDAISANLITALIGTHKSRKTGSR